MYYPYLRGKQFELKALRDFSDANKDEQLIVPIIEPVNQSLNALSTAIEQMFTNGMKFAIILNPNDGDYKHHTVSFNLISEKHGMIEKQDLWIPAFLYQGNPVALNEAITNSSWNNVMLVFKTCADIDNPEIVTLISNKKVSIIVNNFGKTISRRVKKALMETNASIIPLDDCFVNRKRNADYASAEDEPFSEMFYYYDEEGFSGFADYTALPGEYAEGGMLPYALAIHLTYKKAEDQIYIHHFVSDHNFDQSNIKGKFNEAAGKIEPFFVGKDHTPSVDELIDKAKASDGYPGLGYLKKLSVKNHLELVYALTNK